MNEDKHDRAARLAYDRMSAKSWQIDSDDDAIAMALICNFGREDQVMALAAQIRRGIAKEILDRVTDLSCTDELIDNPSTTILKLRAEFEP